MIAERINKYLPCDDQANCVRCFRLSYRWYGSSTYDFCQRSNIPSVYPCHCHFKQGLGITCPFTRPEHGNSLPCIEHSRFLDQLTWSMTVHATPREIKQIRVSRFVAYSPLAVTAKSRGANTLANSIMQGAAAFHDDFPE